MMHLQHSYRGPSDRKGCLYLVPTPIGNLDDITLRALKVLGSVHVILAEDTRHTRKLLTHFDLTTPLESYHEHKSHQKTQTLIDRLLAGENMALVSDAGTPLINDPGHPLVVAALQQEALAVIPLPGANAALTALMASGLPLETFTYYGFFPRRGRDQVALLEAVGRRQETAVFYESPYRLQASLEQALKVLGDDWPTVVCRELTKKFEEFVRGSLGEVLAHYESHPPKGEVVWLLAGGDESEVTSQEEVLTDQDLLDRIQAAIEDQGLKPNQAIKEVAKATQRARNDLYALYHDLD